MRSADYEVWNGRHLEGMEWPIHELGLCWEEEGPRPGR